MDRGAGQVDDAQLVAGLRRGDETAFVALVERYQARMVRLARAFVPNQDVAEDVVQETWKGVFTGLPRYAGRASLKTWLFAILTNCAKTRGRREHLTVPFSSLVADAAGESGGEEPSVEPERFRATDPWRGHWVSVPESWDEVPEERLLAQETRATVRRAIDALPPAQRAVITLRDVEQVASAEVCAILQISEGNQRVLLHRARSKVRRALEQYLRQADP